MDAIIISGGKGTRMVDPLPKGLVLAHGKPILSHQIDYLLPFVDKIVLALGYKASMIQDFVTEQYPDAEIVCSIEQERLGTGGAVKLALENCTADRVLVLNADDITDIDVNHISSLSEHVLCTSHPKLPFGLVESTEGYASFIEKPMMESLWVSCGWYVFNREEILPLLPDKGSLECDVFPQIKLKVHQHSGFWYPLNSKKQIEEFENQDLPLSHQRNV